MTAWNGHSDAGGHAPIRSAFLTAAHLLEARRASLLLREGLDPILTVHAALGIEPHLVPSIRIPYGEGIAGLVAERGVPLFGSVDGQTFVSVPVATERGVEGVFNVTDRIGGKKYGPEHLPAAQRAAHHIADLLSYSRAAARDPVSGLPNRRTFEDMLARELALSERTGKSFAVVFLDLDNLKAINDRFGHSQGDAVIRAVGETLQHALRPYDVAGRYGGDEFALLLPGTGEATDTIADRIAATVAALSGMLRINVSASLGLASWPEDGRTAEDLIAAADARMYAQKRRKKSAREGDEPPPPH